MVGENRTNREIFKEILKELKLIWERAGIPINPDNNCIRQLLLIHDAWLKVKSTEISRRNSDRFLITLEKFHRSMNQLCDLSPFNIEEELTNSRTPKWQEDIEFLKGQRKFPQVGVMAGVDSNSARREKSRRARSRKTNTENQMDGSSTASAESEISIDSSSSGDEFRTKTPRPSSLVLETLTKTLSKETGSTADRVNLSVRFHLLLKASFINAGGADINQMSLSKSAVHRQRKQNRVETANSIKNNFQKPPFAVVHWDSKLIK